MKKLFLALLLNFILTLNANAVHTWREMMQSAIDNHLSGRALDSIEGIWQDGEYGYVKIAIFKYGSGYSVYDLYWHDRINDTSLYKSGTGFKGTCSVDETDVFTNKKKTIGGQALTLRQITDDILSYTCEFLSRGSPTSYFRNYVRVWPSNLKTHNAKFKNKYLPNINFSSSKAASYWWVVFILIALGGFIYTQLKPGKTKNFKIPKLRISSQKKVIFTFIPKLWRGDFPLAISFWVCLIIPSIFFTLLIRMPVTGTAEIILGLFALFFHIYSFIALKGTWYSANNYKAEKEKKKETYGWAIATQIYLVLAVLAFIIDIFRLIR